MIGGHSYKTFTPEQKKRADARTFVHMAVRRGKMVKQSCQFKLTDGMCCGIKEVESHHEDYDKPLEVQWLCKGHHKLVDSIKEIHARSK